MPPVQQQPVLPDRKATVVMRPLLLAFRLHDEAVLTDLLHELNLHAEVEARRKDVPGAHDAVVLVALPNAADLLWSIRSTVSLFDPRAIEIAEGQEA